MKKAIKLCWCITGLAIFIFVLFALFGGVNEGSDSLLWTVFSVTMPIAGIGFHTAIILMIIDAVRSKK